MLVGRRYESTPWEQAAGYLLLLAALVFFLPWIAIAVGCILMGLLAIERSEPSLLIGLPAGLALLLALPLLLYFKRRWYPPVREFEYDQGVLKYALHPTDVRECRLVDEIKQVVPRKGRRGGVYEYLVQFSDGQWISIPSHLTDANELYAALLNELDARKQKTLR
jgi:hypothetical protein